MTSKGATNPQLPDNLIMSRTTRDRNGPLIQHVASDLNQYRGVFFFTEKEITDIYRLMTGVGGPSERDQRVLEYLEKTHPDIKEKISPRVMVDHIWDIARDQSPGQVGAAAYSLALGSPEDIQRLGFVVIPDKPEGPEYLAWLKPEQHSFKPSTPDELEQRHHDNGVVTLMHEIGHLVDAAKRNRYGGTSGQLEHLQDPDTIAAGLHRENFAEHYAFQKIPDLLAAGLIQQDYTQPRIDARNMMAFDHLMKNAHPIGVYGGVGIENHSTGFTADNAAMSGQQIYDHLDKAFSGIRDLRNRDFRTAYEEAAAGRGTPEAQEAYLKTQQELKDPDNWMAQHLRKEGFSERDISLMKFGNILGEDQVANYRFAQKIKDSPELDQAGRHIVQQYLESADRISIFSSLRPEARAPGAFLDGQGMSDFLDRMGQAARKTEVAVVAPSPEVKSPAFVRASQPDLQI